MRSFLARGRPLPSSRVGETYSFPVDSIGEATLASVKEHLTLAPRGAGYGPPPPPLLAWREEEGVLHLPRFYGLERFGPAEEDGRDDGEALPPFPFEASLRPVQVEAAEAVMRKHFDGEGADGGAVICLPCGMGKTVLAVYLLTQRLRRKACVLVHKTVIRDQWKAAFERFCPGLRVGLVQGSEWEVEGVHVVIAMILTVAKRPLLPPSAFASVGAVFVDECHHVAAPVMRQAMEKFGARYRLGLTATPHRADGLTPLLHWSLGKEAFRASREGGEAVRVTIALYPQCVREVKGKDGKPIAATMTTLLAADAGRNRFLASRIAAMRGEGRVVLVLSDRIAQLGELRRLLADSLPAEEVGLYHGGIKEADRPSELAKEVVLCSYGLANEGLDKKEADACVLATPRGSVEQAIGRVQRPCPTKQPPVVLDVADDFSVYRHLGWKRKRLYEKEKYEIEVLRVP